MLYTMQVSTARRHLADDVLAGKDNFKPVLTHERYKDINYRVILNYCWSLLACNFQTGNKKNKTAYEI
jgi:hypothetical protein